MLPGSYTPIQKGAISKGSFQFGVLSRTRSLHFQIFLLVLLNWIHSAGWEGLEGIGTVVINIKCNSNSEGEKKSVLRGSLKAFGFALVMVGLRRCWCADWKDSPVLKHLRQSFSFKTAS